MRVLRAYPTLSIVMALTASVASVLVAATPSAAQSYYGRDRGSLEREAERSREQARRDSERARNLENAYRAAQAADSALGYAAGRVGGAPGKYTYKGTRMVMDAPVQPFTRHVTPFQDCQQMQTVSPVLNCGPAAPR